MSNVNIGSAAGAVIGPGGSTDNAVPKFDGTTGELLEASGVIINDSDQMSGLAQISMNLGTSVNEFSIDGTLAGNSDDAVPTEKAVKTYSDGTSAGNLDYQSVAYVAGAKSRISATNTIVWYEEDEWLIHAASNSFEHPWYQVENGTGATIDPLIHDLSHPGVIRLTTQNASSRSLIGREIASNTDHVYLTGCTKVIWEGLVRVPTLSDATDEFDVYVGVGKSTGFDDNDFTNGAFFAYDRNGLGTTWYGRTDSGGTTSSADTTVTVGTGWHYLRLELTPGVDCKFFVDNYTSTADSTSSTNLPGASDGSTLGMFKMVKTAGTNARSFDIDWSRVIIEMSTDRFS